MHRKRVEEKIEERLSDPDAEQSALMRPVISIWPSRNQTYFFDVILHSYYDEFWDERPISSRLQEIKISMYLDSEHYDFCRFS